MPPLHIHPHTSSNGSVLYGRRFRSEHRRNFQIFPGRRPINSRSREIFPIANRQSAHLADLLREDSSLDEGWNSSDSSVRFKFYREWDKPRYILDFSCLKFFNLIEYKKKRKITRQEIKWEEKNEKWKKLI